MRNRRLIRLVLAAAMGLMCRFAWADLYAAERALGKQEYERAFQLYRELAELGRLEAQENIAAMYVEVQLMLVAMRVLLTACDKNETWTGDLFAF